MYGPTKYLMMYTYIPSTPLQEGYGCVNGPPAHDSGSNCINRSGPWRGRALIRHPGDLARTDKPSHTNPLSKFIALPSTQKCIPVFIWRQPASTVSDPQERRHQLLLKPEGHTTDNPTRRRPNALFSLNLSPPSSYLVTHSISSLFTNLRHPFLSWSDFKK